MEMQNTVRYEELRQKRKAALAERSPRQVGAEKAAAALRWVYAWGWSSPSVIDAWASPGRRGLARRLVRQDLLRAVPTPGGRGVKGSPAEVLLLTPAGVAEVEALLPEADLLPYPLPADRLIRWDQLRHDALVQTWTARRLADRTIDGYVTPRQISGRPSATQVKEPDAVWRWPGVGAVGVELELTAKRDRELHQAALALLRAVHPATENRAGGPYDAAVILSHSDAILGRWRRCLTPGARLPTYERDASRHWKVGGSVTVPGWAADRVIYQRVTL